MLLFLQSQKMQDKLMSWLGTQKGSVSFEVFAAQMNDLVGEDRNWTNLLFVMHLGKRVVQTSLSATPNVREYYGRFVASAFGEEIARSGSAVSSFLLLGHFVRKIIKKIALYLLFVAELNKTEFHFSRVLQLFLSLIYAIHFKENPEPAKKIDLNEVVVCVIGLKSTKLLLFGHGFSPFGRHY